MRRSPWLPVLIVLALGVYLVPKVSDRAPAGPALPATHGPSALAPHPLPGQLLQLFTKSRPASIRVEQLDGQGNLTAIGTGFFIDSKGLFLTAYHVVDGSKMVGVKTVSGQHFFADMVGFDNAADLALLRIRTRGQVPFVGLSDRDPTVGEQVLAIGNSKGQFLQARQGRLLRLGASAERADFPEGTLEMSAPLAPGDSGGPILGPDGRVIGVVSYIRVDDSDQTLTSYAVPVSSGSALLRDLRAGVKRDVPALGVRGAFHSALTTSDGVAIGVVVPGSPAARAGLKGERQVGSGRNRRWESDVILEVDGQSVQTFDDLTTQVRRKRIGDTVVLTVQREGKQLEVPVELAAKGSIAYGSD